jgi:hypothetical protein
MWLTPRGQFLKLKDGRWQADACVSYLVIVGVTGLPCGESPLFRNPLNLLSGIGLTDDPGVTPTG